MLSTALVWRDDLLLTPVLVLDQFEEVFTVHDRAFRDALASELGALATRVPPERTGVSEASNSEPPPTPPDVKILISLREDYLGALEEFSPAIPNLFHERLRLGPLSEEGAREAVTNPAQLVAQSGGEAFWAPLFEFEKSTLDEMITFLKGEAGVIEPFTLQLICRRAESIAHDKGRKGNSLPVLTLADFKDGRDFSQVLKNFYQEAMERLEHRLGHAARDGVEELCEHGLLDREQGRRLLLEERQIQDQFGVDDRALNVLVQERLVRRERRRESTFYEISHDRLAKSIYASRRNKCSKKERDQRRKEEELIKKTYRYILTAVTGVLMAVLITSSYFIVTDRAADIATRLSVAADEGIPLRVRLLSLVDASKNSENAGIRMALDFMFGPHATEANQTLREILARTPIFGGTAQAALNSDGGRLAYLSFSPEFRRRKTGQRCVAESCKRRIRTEPGSCELRRQANRRSARQSRRGFVRTPDNRIRRPCGPWRRRASRDDCHKSRRANGGTGNDSAVQGQLEPRILTRRTRRAAPTETACSLFRPTAQ